MKRRIEEIDIIKAIAIICMVLGHSGSPATSFVYKFHMSVFFIASGFTYKQESSDSFINLRKATLKKIKRLWLPFFFWTALFTLLNNWLISINIYTDNPEILTYTESIKVVNLSRIIPYINLHEMLIRIAKSAVFLQSAPLVDTLWFLKCLFFISFSFSFADWFIKRFFHKDPLVFQIFISAFLLCAGCVYRQHTLWGMANVASCYHLYFIGTLLNRYKEKYSLWQTKQFSLVFLLSFCILIGLYLWDGGKIKIDLAHNNYPNPVLFLAASMSGWALCYSTAWFLKHSRLKPFMVFIGKRTMSILVFHYLAFKIVNAVIVSNRNLPAFCLAACPHLYGDSGLWWLAFTAVGIACPLLLSLIWERTKAAAERKLTCLRRAEPKLSDQDKGAV